MEKHREGQREVLRQELLYSIRKITISEEWKRRDDTVVQGMYDGCRIVVKCCRHDFFSSRIWMVLLHGSALLFSMVMNRLTDKILETSLWTTILPRL